MTVYVEPLQIGSIRVPVVYLCVRRVGRHLDIEQMPDMITNDRDAHAYAAQRWKIPECDVTFKKPQLVEIEP